MAGRRRQFSIEFNWYWMSATPPIRIEYEPNLKTRLPFTRQPIFFAETDHRVFVMRLIPAASCFTLVIVKFWIAVIPVVIVPIVIPVLRHEGAASGHCKRSRGAHRQQPSCFHEFPPIEVIPARPVISRRGNALLSDAAKGGSEQS